MALRGSAEMNTYVLICGNEFADLRFTDREVSSFVAQTVVSHVPDEQVAAQNEASHFRPVISSTLHRANISLYVAL
jgi:hypothetical protein